MNKPIATAFLRLAKRAEATDPAKLVETFVDAEPLLTMLSTTNHQVIYGRRGTGKTHALLYLHETERRKGNVSIYLDMRTVGSTGGIYADTSIALNERATRLLADTLAAVHNSILEFAIESGFIDLTAISPVLDKFADAITHVAVVGSVEVEASGEAGMEERTQSSLDIGGSVKGVDAKLRHEGTHISSQKGATRVKESGRIQHRIHFGAVGQSFHQISRAIHPAHVWILLDEWSSVPLDLQPFLADLIRRAILPHPGLTVKIGAIEQRTAFQLPGERGDYVGVELGADVAADLNLDDFMVFENDSARATRFFQELLFRHYRSVEESEYAGAPQSPAELVQAAFIQWNAFEEYTRATEGVPRDAINILSAATQRAYPNQIAVPQIRSAAKLWYQRDKEAVVSANPNARALLHWVIDEVIGHRRARAFLLRSDFRHDLIDALFDARVLHLLKRNISAHDQPGVRYDVYKLDYGCYVDLLTTVKAPLGLLPGIDDGSYVEVPADDYRAIRRAILDTRKFEAQLDTSVSDETT